MKNPNLKKKILIVDDEKDVLTVLERRLSNAGYSILKAENGEEAVFMANNEQPDLIILDIIMPGMDGARTAEILKNDSATRDIPIIFLTCLLTRKDGRGERIIGGKYFIAKPYNPEKMLQVVDRYAHKKQR